MTEGYAITRLSNGLRLVVTPMPDRYSATAAVYVGTGSRYESAAQAGSAHMLEHMLFKGTQRRPTAEDISIAIESVGGSLNASTDKEVTVYWAKAAGEDVPLALDVLSDMLLHSRLDPAEVRKEKRVVAEELGMAMDAPQDWIHTLIEETIRRIRPARTDPIARACGWRRARRSSATSALLRRASHTLTRGATRLIS